MVPRFISAKIKGSITSGVNSTTVPLPAKSSIPWLSRLSGHILSPSTSTISHTIPAMTRTTLSSPTCGPSSCRRTSLRASVVVGQSPKSMPWCPCSMLPSSSGTLITMARIQRPPSAKPMLRRVLPSAFVVVVIVVVVLVSHDCLVPFMLPLCFAGVVEACLLDIVPGSSWAYP